MTTTPTLPSLSDWMTMRAKVTSVLGEQPATTLLALLPSPVEGGFATNNRLDLLETRLRSEILELRGEMRAEIANVRAEIAEFRGELRAEIVGLNGELRAEVAGLRTEIAKSALDTIRSMRSMFFQLVGVMVSLGGIALAVAKFL